MANESIPLKHVLGCGGGGGGGSQGVDLTLNSLLRTWLSLQHPPSFRAFKQLECMDKSWRYLLLLQLSQFKVCGLQESDGTVFINPPYIYIYI